MATSSTDYVQEFNKLFHGKYLRQSFGSTVRGFPNEWHFDIRYVALPPFVGHLLVLSLNETNIKIVPMPLEAKSYNRLGSLFFPESGEEAAPETVRIIMHIFTSKIFPDSSISRPAKIAPFKLTTNDEGLANAVAAEFKRLGSHSGLHNILCKSTTSKTQEAVAKYIEKLLEKCPFSPHERRLFRVPVEPLKFVELHITDPLDAFTKEIIAIAEKLPTEERAKYEQCVRYVKEWALIAQCLPDTSAANPLIEEAREVMERHATHTIKEIADEDGCNSTLALEYGMRARTGFGCERNRREAYNYLTQITICTHSSTYQLAIAHSALIHWHTNAQAERRIMVLDRRYLLAACHHANTAAMAYEKLNNASDLMARTDPEHLPASPRVLTFMNTIFNEYKWEYTEIEVLTKVAQHALYEQHGKLLKDSPWEHHILAPKYTCASCNLVVDRGNMLRECGGKCDRTMKPRYCSKECQKADWMSHKPFCSPGAPCSVRQVASR